MQKLICIFEKKTDENKTNDDDNENYSMTSFIDCLPKISESSMGNPGNNENMLKQKHHHNHVVSGLLKNNDDMDNDDQKQQSIDDDKFSFTIIFCVVDNDG